MKQTSNAIIIQPIQKEEAAKENDQIQQNTTQENSNMQHQKKQNLFKTIT
ncbi:hypothetical protein [Priestia aryabhattai]